MTDAWTRASRDALTRLAETTIADPRADKSLVVGAVEYLARGPLPPVSSLRPESLILLAQILCEGSLTGPERFARDRERAG